MAEYRNNKDIYIGENVLYNHAFELNRETGHIYYRDGNQGGVIGSKNSDSNAIPFINFGEVRDTSADNLIKVFRTDVNGRTITGWYTREMIKKKGVDYDE